MRVADSNATGSISNTSSNNPVDEPETHDPPTPVQSLSEAPTTTDTLLAQTNEPEATSTEILAQAPTTSEQLSDSTSNADTVDAFQKPNFLDFGLNMGRDNQVRFGLFGSRTIDGLIESPNTIGIGGGSLSSGFLTNEGNTYYSSGIGRTAGGMYDSNNQPLTFSPTDTRTPGVTSFGLGVATIPRPSETTQVDASGNIRTSSANQLILGPNTGDVAGFQRGLELNAGGLFGLVGTEGTDQNGNANYADFQLQLGIAGNVGYGLSFNGPNGSEVGVSGGVGAQEIFGIGASVEDINPPNMAPATFDDQGNPLGSIELPDQFTYNESDQTIIDWSSWYQNKVYDARTFNLEDPGEPVRTEFAGIRESSGRFTYEVLQITGNSLIKAGSRAQQVSNETFEELDSAPGALIDQYKATGRQLVDGTVESFKSIPGSINRSWNTIVDAFADPWRR